MKAKLKRLLLLSLLRCDGVPMPEDALIGAVQAMCHPERATMTDVKLVLGELEGAGNVQGLSDDITGASWTLTGTGKHRAAQLV